MYVYLIVFICVLSLRDNLFECSHSLILLSSLFILISIKVATFFPVKNKFCIISVYNCE